MTVEPAPVACGSCGAELARGSRRRAGTSVLCAGCRGRHVALHQGRADRYARDEAGIWQPWDAVRCS